MKILLVTPMPPQSNGAGAIPVLLHAELTSLRLKHDVSLATVAGLEPGEQEAILELRQAGISVRAVQKGSQTSREQWERRWRLASSWLRGLYPWRTIWFWEPSFQAILDDWFARESFDLVLVEDNAMGLYRYHVPAPIIFTEHEVRRTRPVDWKGFIQNNPLKWALREADWARWGWYQRMVWRKFDRIQVFTERDAAEIRHMVPELSGRVRINPFGVNLPGTVNLDRQVEGELLFVGNFTHPPNVDAALWLGQEIMPLLRAQYPAVKLTLVGIYPPKAVQKLAGEDIEVTGPVPQIEPYMERAAVILAPIRIGGGMRMKVLHGMAMGKAIVTTPRGAEGLEIGGYKPPLKIASSSQEFAREVVLLLKNRSERLLLGQQAREYVQQHYSAQAYADRIEQTYAELCASRVEQKDYYATRS